MKWNDVMMVVIMLGFDVFALIASLIENPPFFHALVLANLVIISAFCYASELSEKKYENVPQ